MPTKRNEIAGPNFEYRYIKIWKTNFVFSSKRAYKPIGFYPTYRFISYVTKVSLIKDLKNLQLKHDIADEIATAVMIRFSNSQPHKEVYITDQE